jgi:hypothetical protein
LDAQFFFQGLDLSADGRLRQVKRFGRLAEAQMVGDRAKDDKPEISRLAMSTL